MIMIVVMLKVGSLMCIFFLHESGHLCAYFSCMSVSLENEDSVIDIVVKH